MKILHVILILLLTNYAAADHPPQITSTVLMVPPTGFIFNPETAKSNVFQHQISNTNVTQQALSEFTQMVKKLRDNGVNVLILNQDPKLPDAIFHNNWFTTSIDHYGKSTLILYPMLTKSRQGEVNPHGFRSE